MKTIRQMTACFIVLIIMSVSARASRPSSQSDVTPAKGPLRVHPVNPRYFFDGTKGIYLCGHQIFVDVQDNSFNKEWVKDMGHPEEADKKSRLLDWESYLDFVDGLDFNFVRA